MLKSVLYYLLLAITTIRFVDLIYLLSTNSTSLPIPVILVSAVMILYGIVLAAKRFTGVIRLKQLRYFYAIQAVMVAFNIAYVALFSPLHISGAEILLMGTFLDLVIYGGVIYFCTRRMRTAYVRTFARG